MTPDDELDRLLRGLLAKIAQEPIPPALAKISTEFALTLRRAAARRLQDFGNDGK